MGKELAILGQMYQRTPEMLGALRERAMKSAVPYHALIYLENKCNLKCRHCYEDETTHPTQEHLSLAEVTSLLEQLAALGTLQLTFSGGEIFLRRDILEILAVAKRLRFHTTLFTSGYFIDRDKAEKLKALGVGQVDISIYSDLAADHDMFTQIPGSHKRSVEALRLLTEVGVPAALKCVLTTFNVDRIDNILALARELKVDHQFDPNVRPRMSNDRSTLKYALDVKTIADKVFSRRDLYPGYREVAPDKVCRGSEFRHGDEAMCGAGSSTMAISAMGDVLPCGFFPTGVGNIKQNPLKEIWQRSATLQDMRAMTYNKMTSCKTCDVKAACHPCMAYAQVEHQDYKACNTASRTSAEALLHLSQRAARTNKKFARAGKTLAIVGETHLPEADGTTTSTLATFD